MYIFHFQIELSPTVLDPLFASMVPQNQEDDTLSRTRFSYSRITKEKRPLPLTKYTSTVSTLQDYSTHNDFKSRSSAEATHYSLQSSES